MRVDLIAQWATPIGPVSIAAGTELSGRDAPPGTHMLVVRTIKDGRQRARGYRINCDRAFRLFLNGTFTALVDRGRTVIEAVPGTDSVIAVVDAESNLDPDMRPLPQYRQLWTQEVRLPNPLAESGLGADLDVPISGHFGIGAMDSEDADLFYNYGTGLRGGYYGSMGFTQAPSPVPEQCRAEAEANAAGTVDPESLHQGQTFCVVTSEGNVAHVNIANVIDDHDDPAQYALVLQVTLWIPNELEPPQG